MQASAGATGSRGETKADKETEARPFPWEATFTEAAYMRKNTPKTWSGYIPRDVEKQRGRAFPSIPFPEAPTRRKLRPSFLAAPESNRLPLLPSGPDGVHGLSPRKTQPSTPLTTQQPSRNKNLTESCQPRYSGLRVQGTASSPSSTTSFLMLRNAKPERQADMCAYCG